MNPVIVVYFTASRAKYVNHYALLFKRNFISENVCIPTEASCHRRPPCCTVRQTAFWSSTSPFCTLRTHSPLPRPILKMGHLFSLIYTKFNSSEYSLLLVTWNTLAIGKCEFHRINLFWKHTYFCQILCFLLPFLLKCIFTWCLPASQSKYHKNQFQWNNSKTIFFDYFFFLKLFGLQRDLLFCTTNHLEVQASCS